MPVFFVWLGDWRSASLLRPIIKYIDHEGYKLIIPLGSSHMHQSVLRSCLAACQLKVYVLIYYACPRRYLHGRAIRAGDHISGLSLFFLVGSYLSRGWYPFGNLLFVFVYSQDSQRWRRCVLSHLLAHPQHQVL